MKKLFRLAIFVYFALIPFAVKADPISIFITPDVTTAQLAGSSAGNIPSFQVKFALDTQSANLPTNALIQSANITYTQAGISGGLLRIIDDYSADVIDSKSMATAGQYEITSALSYVRRWFSLPPQNLGLLFQASSLAPTDSITISNIQLQIDYTLPDLIPPALNGDIKVDVSTTTANISITTDKPAFVNLDYGRTSNYGQKYTTDNIEPTFDHLVSLLNLTSGSTYHYKITMTDASGNHATTLDLNFETLADFDTSTSKPVDQSLQAPQEFQVDAIYTYGKAQASLSWNPSNENGIKGYIIYRADSVSKQYVEYATLDYKTNTYIDSAVNLGETYYYYVRSYSDLVISPKSDEKFVTFSSVVPNKTTEQPPTLQTFLIVLAAAALVIFIVYLIIKVIQQANSKKGKRLKNVLKDPAFFNPT